MIIASCKAGKGSTLCFWSDTWDLGVQESSRKSLQKILMQDESSNFFAPLSETAAGQWEQLSQSLMNLQLNALEEE
jgi:hypothetical protein